LQPAQDRIVHAGSVDDATQSKESFSIASTRTGAHKNPLVLRIMFDLIHREKNDARSLCKSVVCRTVKTIAFGVY
jgi:hypothetical protein